MNEPTYLTVEGNVLGCKAGALRIRLLLAVAVTWAGMAAGGQTKKTEMFPTPNVGHGKEVFEEKCAICHYATSDAMKIGPGLRGFSKRGGFSGTRGRVLDDSLRSWIESGDTKMPPMKGKLDASELRDVIAYVKTL